MIKKIGFIIALFFIGPAFAGQIASIEYVHSTILAKTGISVPYNANVTNVQAAANTTYLLTAIDAMNFVGVYSTATNFRETSYATLQAVDTTAVDWAANNLLNCNVAGRYVNNGNCLLCPDFAYCPPGTSDFISCEEVCDGCAAGFEGATDPSQCSETGRALDLTTPTYFDTGINTQGDWKIEAKYKMSSYLIDQNPGQTKYTSALFCSRNNPRSTSVYGICHFLMANSLIGRADCGTATTTLPKWDTDVHTIVMGREEGVIFDGVVKKSNGCTITQGYKAPDGEYLNFIIGAVINDNNPSNLNYAPFYGKIYYFKIWKDNLLVRNFVPIYAGETINGVTATENAMFDMVTNTVFYNLAN